MRIKCGGEFVRLQPHLLGAGLLLGAVLEVLRASGIDWTREDGSLALAFNQWAAMALVAIAVVHCAGWSLRTGGGGACRPADDEPSASAHRPMLSGATALAACAVLLLAGCYVTGAPLLAADLSLPSMIVTGSAFALGIAAFATLWFSAYVALDTRSALVHAALCIGVAALVRFVMEQHDALTSLLVFATCCLASYGCIVSCLGAMREPENAKGSEGEEMPGGRAALRGVTPILWLPLAAVSIVGFIQGLVWNPIASQTASTGPLDLQMLDLPLGGLAACVLALLFLRHAASESQCQRIANVGFPITMGILLLYPVVVPGGSIAADLTGWLPQCCFALVILFTWHSLTTAQRASQRADLPVLSFGLVFIGFSYFLGLTLIHVIGTGGRDLCLVFLTIYLVLFCVSLTQETKTEQQGRVSDELRPETFIHRRCDELAAEHGISPRETEVLYYLGRGYNHAYIARKLFVSENTVRTHVRHIYGKLGISSREDLLDLIDEDTADSTEAPHRA